LYQEQTPIEVVTHLYRNLPSKGELLGHKPGIPIIDTHTTISLYQQATQLVHHETVQK